MSGKINEINLFWLHEKSGLPNPDNPDNHMDLEQKS